MVSGTLTDLREYPHVRLEQELYDRRQIFDEQNYKFYQDREVDLPCLSGRHKTGYRR